MPPPAQRRFWRTLRRVWRGCRITGLFLLFVLFVGLIHLNRAGLPDFARQSVLASLRARGLEFEAARLRLSLHRGVVAEDVRFGRAEAADLPRFTARSLEVKLNYLALAKRQWQVTGVVLNQGRLTWPVADTNGPPFVLDAAKIRATLRLLPGDEWALDHFHALFAGGDLTLSGSVTNASAIRDWPLFRGERPAGTTQRRLRRFAETLEGIHFAARPKLRLMIDGDARDLHSFTAHLSLDAPDADTPWGRITNGIFTARLFPATSAERVRADVSLQAEVAQTPWANVAGLDLELHLVSSAGQTNVVEADLTAKAGRARTQWGGVTDLQFAANWFHSLTNAIPLSGRGELHSAFVDTPWASGRELRLEAALATITNAPPAEIAWAWWTNVQPYELDLAGGLSHLEARSVTAEKVVIAGQWRAPELIVTNLHADFADGALDARAQLDVVTREARFDLTSDFDLQKISPLLTDKARRWLGKFSWRNPPRLVGGGSVILPAWTNRQQDWRGEVQPTLRLAGEFAVTNGAYLGIAADWARSQFNYSNRVWRLPDLEAGRSGGQLRLTHIANETAQEFYWRVHSTIDPRAVRPLLATNEQRGFDLVTFTQPPVVDGEVWGRMHEPGRIGFQGRVAMTNFAVRGQPADWLETSVRYTNRFLEFLEPHLLRGTQALSAAGIAVDFNTQRIHFTNGFSTAEPLVVARAIGPHIERDVEPYRFVQPPTVRVSGYAPLHGSKDADLQFAVDGGPLEWWKFKVPHVVGDVHWLGEKLTLTNVNLAFYGGDAAGFAHFDFTPERGDDFNFTVGVTNANLPLLVAAVAAHTNRLEGALSGWLVISHANTAEPGSWTGSGRARLRDGFLWETPIFGILSKPLDALMPGVGSSRFSAASARFTLANSAITWDKLEMRAPTMRLQYDGQVDFDGRVDMRVEVEPLRDTWVVGRIVSLAFWPMAKLFQYRISGTLSEPKSEPVYVPKLLMLPLQPFRTLEEWFGPGGAATNAPPVFKELPQW